MPQFPKITAFLLTYSGRTILRGSAFYFQLYPAYAAPMITAAAISALVTPSHMLCYLSWYVFYFFNKFVKNTQKGTFLLDMKLYLLYYVTIARRRKS